MSYSECKKKYRTVASFTTNINVPGHESWDLTPYKTAGMGPPGGTWRIIEVGYPNLYDEGKISADGTLVSSDYVEPAAPLRSGTPSGLPDSFDHALGYDGFMELQIAEPEPKCTTCPCPENEKEEECKCKKKE